MGGGKGGGGGEWRGGIGCEDCMRINRVKADKETAGQGAGLWVWSVLTDNKRGLGVGIL